MLRFLRGVFEHDAQEPLNVKTLVAALAALGAMAMVSAPAFADRDDHRGRHERGDRSGWYRRGSDRGQLLSHGNEGGQHGRAQRPGRSPARLARRPQGGQQGGPGENRLLGGLYSGRNRSFHRVPDDRVQDQAGRNWGRSDHGPGSRRDAHRDDDGRRDWSHHLRGRDDWAGGRRGHNWGGDDNRDRDWRKHERWRQHAHLQRDFDHPRYIDSRHVPYGRYFDNSYARIVGGYYGGNYRWWSYPSWRRPYRPYAVGYVLPAYIDWYPVPYDLYYQLPPAPYGCRYILVDGDILLIGATGLVLDALLVLSSY